MDDLHYMSAVEALRLFRSRKLSPVELMEAVVARAEAVEPTVNALCLTYFDEAMEAARVAEAAYMGRGEPPGPLCGLPVANKDSIPVAGQPCSSGSLAHKDDIAPASSVLIERILASGGILHARTTTPEFSCAGFTHSRLWGITRNPWNPEYAVGGSSGGAGAALAAGTTTLATGGDIAGSIRVPACANGVVGFKAPFGRVPQDPPYNLDNYCQMGAMARTVGDCALLHNVISGPDYRDLMTVTPKVEIPLDPEGIEGMRVALVVAPERWSIDPEVASNTRTFGNALAEAGALVDEVRLSLDREEVLRATYVHLGAIFGTLIMTEIEAHPDLVNPYTVRMAETTTRAAREIGLAGGLILESRILARIGEVLQAHELLVLPTMLSRGLLAGEDYVDVPLRVGEEDLEEYFAAGLTTLFNMASRCPVLNVPSGFADNGIPTGVQIVGRPYEDISVFRAGAAYEKLRPWLDVPQRRPMQIMESGVEY